MLLVDWRGQTKGAGRRSGSKINHLVVEVSFWIFISGRRLWATEDHVDEAAKTRGACRRRVPSRNSIDTISSAAESSHYILGYGPAYERQNESQKDHCDEEGCDGYEIF